MASPVTRDCATGLRQRGVETNTGNCPGLLDERAKWHKGRPVRELHPRRSREDGTRGGRRTHRHWGQNPAALPVCLPVYFMNLVGLVGLEPTTLGLKVRCATELRHKPDSMLILAILQCLALKRSC